MTMTTRALSPLRLFGWLGLLGVLSLAAGSAAAQTPATPAAPPKTAPPVSPAARAPAAVGPAVLEIAGDVATGITMTPADLKAMPRTTVTVTEEGHQTTYEGVLVSELLKRAGAPLGRDLSGKALASYVRASAADGYQVVFSLGELDQALAPNDIIVADTIDGKPLFDYQGAFRIVAPHDKRAARSVRMLQRLDVVRLSK